MSERASEKEGGGGYKGRERVERGRTRVKYNSTVLPVSITSRR